jgi:hypothetical protein
VHSEAIVDVSNLVVDGQGLDDIEWQPAIWMDLPVTATITALKVSGAGPIHILSGRSVMLQDVVVEEPRSDQALWLHGPEVVVNRARIGVRPSVDDSAITIGDRFLEGTASVRLENIALSGSNQGNGLSVVGGKVVLRSFSISNFAAGIRSEVDPRRLLVSGGRIAGNAVGVDYDSPEAPRLFDTRVDNAIELQRRQDE